MNTNIKRLCEEGHEILTHIREAACKGDITWAQRDELVKIMLSDVADAAKLPKVEELLHAWAREEELV